MPVKRSGGGAGRLKQMTAAARRNLSAAVYTIADDVKTDAQISLSHGSAGGSSGGKHQHQPSAPGTPPNSFSGALADSIEVEKVTDIHARVVVHSPYGAIQELGGTIHHPGGTAYFMKDGKPVFVGRAASSAFAFLPRTQPHDITLPERPYMRPAGKKNLESGRKKMRAAVAQAFSSGKT